MNAKASATSFVAAGDYVQFTYTLPSGDVNLEVFSAATGHTEIVTNYSTPANHNGPAMYGPHTQLASSGWLGQIYGLGIGGTVDATDTQAGLAGAGPQDIDTGEELTDPDPKPTGSTFTWSPDNGATLYSVPLGPDLAVLGSAALEAGTVHAVSPAPTACSLFAEAEARAILGPVTQASRSDSCSYVTTGSSPQSALTLTLQPNLTAAQTLAAKQAAYAQYAVAVEAGAVTGEPEAALPPDYDDYLWTETWDTATSGFVTAQAAQILGDTALSVDLTTTPAQTNPNYDVGISQCWSPEEAVSHVTDIAFDRLIGLPVTYRIHSAVKSCVQPAGSF